VGSCAFTFISKRGVKDTIKKGSVIYIYIYIIFVDSAPFLTGNQLCSSDNWLCFSLQYQFGFASLIMQIA